MRSNLMSGLVLLFLAGCDALGPGLNGDWDLEVVNADDCSMTLELEQAGEDIDGDADVDCMLFFNIYGEVFSFTLEAKGADVKGDIDKKDGEFDLEVSFYDSFFEDEIVIELSGEMDGDDIEGDIVVDGADFGEFEGSRD